MPVSDQSIEKQRGLFCRFITDLMSTETDCSLTSYVFIRGEDRDRSNRRMLMEANYSQNSLAFRIQLHISKK